jgi:hypothetical protein
MDIKSIIGIFGEPSGMHVNFAKTTANLIRVNEGDAEEITQILGCQTAQFPIKYMGLQLAQIIVLSSNTKRGRLKEQSLPLWFCVFDHSTRI